MYRGWTGGPGLYSKVKVDTLPDHARCALLLPGSSGRPCEFYSNVMLGIRICDWHFRCREQVRVALWFLLRIISLFASHIFAIVPHYLRRMLFRVALVVCFRNRRQ